LPATAILRGCSTRFPAFPDPGSPAEANDAKNVISARYPACHKYNKSYYRSLPANEAVKDFFKPVLNQKPTNPNHDPFTMHFCPFCWRLPVTLDIFSQCEKNLHGIQMFLRYKDTGPNMEVCFVFIFISAGLHYLTSQSSWASLFFSSAY